MTYLFQIDLNLVHCFVIYLQQGSDEHYRMNTGSPVIGHKRTMPLSQYDDYPQVNYVVLNARNFFLNPDVPPW